MKRLYQRLNAGKQRKRLQQTVLTQIVKLSANSYFSLNISWIVLTLDLILLCEYLILE